jgi:hypothetical protein
MNGVQEQGIHARWFPRLLGPAIRWAVEAQSVTLTEVAAGGELSFDRRRFFRHSGIELSSKEQFFYYEPIHISPDSIDFLRQVCSPRDTLITYELSHQSRELLTQAGLTYIDFWLHPVRFYDDIFFAVSSNDEAIRERLAAWRLDSRLLKLRATEIVLSLIRGHARQYQKPPDNSALFVGQTPYDKALLHKGRMLNLLDYQKQFEALSERYDVVLFSRHPLVHSGDGDVLRYIRTLPFARFVRTPSYFLLGAEQVHGVYSISSSVVHEASYFGKETEYFHAPPVPMEDTLAAPAYTAIHGHFLTPQFWGDVLSSRHEVTSFEALDLPSKPNRLRDALGMVYGFEYIDKLESLRNRLWWARDFKGVAGRRIRSIARGLARRR